MSVIVRTENLRKSYGSLVAVDNLCLEIDQGDIMGFIGPNGAGKTTTIKMISTLLKPTSGAAYVNDIDVCGNPEDVRRMIGYMPDFFGVYDDVKVWEYLDFFAAAYKVAATKREQMISDVLELTDLGTKRDDFVESLSRGMKQRLCLAKTLLHDPAVLLLDEPASGLDPRARIDIKELLRQLKAMGKTILISSHILPELADFCNKIAVIERGELIVSGDVEQIMEQARGGRIIEVKLVDRQDEAVALFSSMHGVKKVEPEDGILKIQYVGDPDLQYELLTELIAGGFKVQSFCEAQVDLEDIFMKVTTGAVA
jgi:ABC-2 type transport system ATP-binding protein